MTDTYEVVEITGVVDDCMYMVIRNSYHESSTVAITDTSPLGLFKTEQEANDFLKTLN